MPRRLLLLILLIVASQAWPLSHLVPVLPAGGDPSRSPSSDALMGALPFPDTARRLDDIARALPREHGVVVAHGTPDQLASAYFVVAMRLWPRPVSYVACAPTPYLEHFRAPHAPPRFHWRLDLRPGSPAPVTVGGTPTQPDAAALCREGTTP